MRSRLETVRENRIVYVVDASGELGRIAAGVGRRCRDDAVAGAE